METLVLNATYEPVARVPWQRAITLLFLGKVEVVEEYEDKKVRSVTLELRMPCLLYTSPSPRDRTRSRMPSSA